MIWAGDKLPPDAGGTRRTPDACRLYPVGGSIRLQAADYTDDTWTMGPWKGQEGWLLVDGDRLTGWHFSWDSTDGDNRKWPIAPGMIFPLAKGSFYVRKDAGATGTPQLSLWPFESKSVVETVARAISARAISDESRDQEALLTTIRNVLQDLNEELGGDAVDRSSDEGTSAANTAQTLQIAAPGAGKALVVPAGGVQVFTRGAAVGSDGVVQIKDGAGGTIVKRLVFGQGEPRGSEKVLSAPVQLSEDNGLDVVVPALGTGVITEAQADAFTISV